MDVLILMPLFNDWTSAGELLQRLDQAFLGSDRVPAVMIIDDGSTTPPDPAWSKKSYRKIASVQVLKLKTNLGHQRALAVGLSYVAEKVDCKIVVVMDCDGEDQAADALRLVEKAGQLDNETLVFAQRTRRSESFGFWLGYVGFRVLHYLMTGRGIDIGNFSAVPARLLPALTLNPMLWNHYAASIMRSRRSFVTLPTRRGSRIDGRSKLKVLDLIIHGLQALACYSDIIGVRVIISAFVVSVIALLVLLGILAIKIFTNLAIPGWSSLVGAMTVLLLVQIITLASNFTIQIISDRGTQPFLPARDYGWFVGRLEHLYPEA